jgi:hypothetical protein
MDEFEHKKRKIRALGGVGRWATIGKWPISGK